MAQAANPGLSQPEVGVSTLVAGTPLLSQGRCPQIGGSRVVLPTPPFSRSRSGSCGSKAGCHGACQGWGQAKPAARSPGLMMRITPSARRALLASGRRRGNHLGPSGQRRAAAIRSCSGPQLQSQRIRALPMHQASRRGQMPLHPAPDQARVRRRLPARPEFTSPSTKQRFPPPGGGIGGAQCARWYGQRVRRDNWLWRWFCPCED